VSSGRGRKWLREAYLVAVFAVPGTGVWTGLGAGLGSTGLSKAALVGAAAYAGLFGAVEVLRLPLRELSLQWQVPATWVRGRSWRAQAAIWGLLLGPGLLTRNTYAGMWLVPILLASSNGLLVGAVVGAIVGFTHGISRGVTILRLMGRIDCRVETATIVLTRMRWKLIDGLALTVAAGMFLGIVL
jgi:hypothetical protein